MLTETDPLGNTTTFTYQTFSKFGLIASVQGARPYTRLATTTDPLGNTTTNTYDGGGNLLTTTDAAGNATAFTYDASGNQTSITDALGNLTVFEYEAITKPDGTIGYSPNLIRQVDALGNETTSPTTPTAIS